MAGLHHPLYVENNILINRSLTMKTAVRFIVLIEEINLLKKVKESYEILSSRSF